MDMSLSELWELVIDREAWHAPIHGVSKSRTRLSDWTKLHWTPTITNDFQQFQNGCHTKKFPNHPIHWFISYQCHIYPLLIQLPRLFNYSMNTFEPLNNPGVATSRHFQMMLHPTVTTVVLDSVCWRQEELLPCSLPRWLPNSKASQKRLFTSATLFYSSSPADIFQNFNNKINALHRKGFYVVQTLCV